MRDLLATLLLVLTASTANAVPEWLFPSGGEMSPDDVVWFCQREAELRVPIPEWTDARRAVFVDCVVELLPRAKLDARGGTSGWFPDFDRHRIR